MPSSLSIVDISATEEKEPRTSSSSRSSVFIEKKTTIPTVSAPAMMYTPTNSNSEEVDDGDVVELKEEKDEGLLGVVEEDRRSFGAQRIGAHVLNGLPSPPLTRVGTNESRSTRAGTTVVAAEEEPKEIDAAAWKEVDLGDVEEGLSESGGGEANAWRRDSEDGRRHPLHPLNLDEDGYKPAPSPPIWEVISPPEDDDEPHRFRDLEAQQEHALHSRAGSSRRLVPKSSYYYGPPSVQAAYGSAPVGQIGVHHPREIVRIERDYSGGELVQFAPVYPLEFEGRITAARFLDAINLVNEILISAHSLRHAALDNALAFFSLQISKLVTTTHYEKEMRRLKNEIEKLNADTFNPVGLNMIWPREVAFMFLEIEYY